MAEKTATEISGLEFDWLASDADGRVAFFSTAGGGYAPQEFLRDTDAHDAGIKAILASPAFTEARFAPILAPQCQNTWRDVAERGIFAFDSDPHGGPYRLVAAPEVPIRVEELPALAGTVVGLLVLPQLRLVEIGVVRVALLRPSE